MGTESPTQAPAAPDPNEVKSALDAIDFEIAEVRGAHRGSGWTLWGVLAALAAVTWLVAELLKTETLSQVVVFRLFFLGALAMEIVAGLAAVFQIQYPLFPLRDEKRLSIGWGVPANGLEVLIGVARTAVLVWIAAFKWPEVDLLVRIATYAYLVLPWPLIVFVLIMRILAFPVRVGTSKPMVRVQIAIGMIILTLSTILLVKYASVFLRVTYATVPDYQFAGLLVAVLFLLGRLARLYRHAPTLIPLLEVRRDVVFSRIRPHEALRRLESIVVGKTGAELVSEAMDPLRARLGESRAYKRAMRAADRLTAKYRTESGSPGVVPDAEVVKWWTRDVGRWGREQKRSAWHLKWLKLRLRFLTAGDAEASEVATKELKSFVEAELGKAGPAGLIIALMDRRMALLGKTRPTKPDTPTAPSQLGCPSSPSGSAATGAGH